MVTNRTGAALALIVMPEKTDTRPNPPTPDTGNAKDVEQKTFDLSLTQVVGGALAAMTAAYLGSRMSVAGTVIGAALASIVAGVAGSLYTASLRHTRDRVRSVWTGRTNSTPTEVVVTRELSVPDWGQGATAASTAPAVAAANRPVPLWRTGRLWKRIAVGAVATFALAVGAITGLELVSGEALSGGEGTTVSRVREPQAAAPSDEQSNQPSESPSASPSDEPSESPSESTSEEPTQEPSAAPSASSEPSPSNEAPAPAEGGESAADGNRAPSSSAEAGSEAEPGADTGADPAG